MIAFDPTPEGAIVLRRRLQSRRVWEEPRPPGAVKVYMYMEFVLVPASKRLEGEIASRIAWKHVAKGSVTSPICLGEGRGFTWFTRTTISQAQWLRETLGLAGGDNLLELAAQALGKAHAHGGDDYSVSHVLGSAGEKAIPYIQRAIRESADRWPYPAVSALGRIPGEKSTRILRSLYSSPKKMVSEAAASALTIRPYRRAAKREYLDMLRRQTGVWHAAKACVKFGWRDAIPVLEAVCAAPKEWTNGFRPAFEAKRELEGRPVAKEVRDGEETLGSVFRDMHYGVPADLAAVEKAKNAIIASADKEAAAVAAISLAMAQGKLTSRQAEIICGAGREILWELPESTTRPLLKRVAGSLEEREGEEIAALLEGG